MDPQRRLAIVRTRTAVAQMHALRVAIDEAEARSLAICGSLESGASVEESFEAADASSTRKRLTDAVAEYERLRHDARLALMLLGVSEGMTKSAIARTWGISAQWAGHEVEAARQTAAMSVEPQDTA